MNVFIDQTYTLIPDTASVSIMWSSTIPSPGIGQTAIALFYPLVSLEGNFITLSVARIWQGPDELIQTGTDSYMFSKTMEQEWNHDVKAISNSNMDASFGSTLAPAFPLLWTMKEIHGDSRVEEEK